MGNWLSQLLAGIGEALSQKSAKILIVVLVALVLYGVVPQGRFLYLIALIVSARPFFLAGHAFRRLPTDAEWEVLRLQLITRYEAMQEAERLKQCRQLGAPPGTSPTELASLAIAKERDRVSRRADKIEAACEAVGLVSFGILLPVDIAFFTRDFVSIRSYEGWSAIAVTASGFMLYLLPLAWRHPWPRRVRLLWWRWPLLPLTLVFYVGIAKVHPYLDPTNKDRVRLAAERVLHLKDWVVAGRHAEWVGDYARQLENKGQTDRAAHYYRESLRLGANQQGVRSRLEAMTGGITRRESTTKNSIHAPYWSDGQRFPHLPVCKVDETLENLDRMTVVILNTGDVPADIIDAVGYVLERELGLPACAVQRPVPLPNYTRKRGIAVGPQWSVESLMDALRAYATHPPKRTPARYLLLTSVDIYTGEANYVFAGGYANWGAVVSAARFGDPSVEPTKVVQRVAKQSLSSIIKSFGLLTSTDIESATSYVRDLDEFDQKGNRLSAESLAPLKQAIRTFDEQWANRRRLAQ